MASKYRKLGKTIKKCWLNSIALYQSLCFTWKTWNNAYLVYNFIKPFPVIVMRTAECLERGCLKSLKWMAAQNLNFIKAWKRIFWQDWAIDLYSFKYFGHCKTCIFAFLYWKIIPSKELGICFKIFLHECAFNCLHTSSNCSMFGNKKSG